MPDYRTHLMGGSVVYVLLLVGLYGIYSVGQAYAQFSLWELVIVALGLFGICILFSLWPDVDTNSKAQTLFYTIFLVIDGVIILAKHFEVAAYFGLLAFLPVLSRHRGWTHSWWATLLVPLPLLVLPMVVWPERPLVGLPFYLAALLGYTSHLVLDWLRRRR